MSKQTLLQRIDRSSIINADADLVRTRMEKKNSETQRDI